MRTIINGRLYNTETAKEIFTNDIHDVYGSWHIYETLYKKKTGEYFIQRDMVGDGDAIDEFNWVMAHRFHPLTVDEARSWMEMYTGVDDYEQEFGLPEE